MFFFLFCFLFSEFLFCGKYGRITGGLLPASQTRGKPLWYLSPSANTSVRLRCGICSPPV